MQVIHLGGGKYLNVEKTFADGGKTPEYAMQGGHKVLLDNGKPPRPTIHMGASKDFYYEDGTPVTSLEHVSQLPENIRTVAENFVRGLTQPNSGVEKPKLTAVSTSPIEKKGPGRPKKAQPKTMVIANEQSLEAVVGKFPE